MRLTNGQLLALEHFQDHHGRKWRANLQWAWCSAGQVQGVSEDEAACLRQLRNNLGPTWLIAYRLGDTQVGVLQHMPQRYAEPDQPNWRILAYKDIAGDQLAAGFGCVADAKQFARRHNITLVEDV